MKGHRMKNSKIVFVKPLSGEEISLKLKITRQAVSNTLKRAMAKVYKEVYKLNPTYSPFQIASEMVAMFHVRAEEDVCKMFNLFPPKLKKDIKRDAKNYYKEVTIINDEDECEL
jgi:hypothetical protein